MVIFSMRELLAKLPGMWTVTSPVLIAIATLIISYLKDLGGSARRARSLDEAKKRMDFWVAWQQLPDLQADAKTRAAKELSRVAALVENMYSGLPSGWWTTEEYTAYYQHLPNIRKWLFLHRLPSPEVRLFVVLLYLSLYEGFRSIYKARVAYTSGKWWSMSNGALGVLIGFGLAFMFWSYVWVKTHEYMGAEPFFETPSQGSRQKTDD